MGLVVAHGDALEALELTDCLFDAGAEGIEALGKKATSVLGVFATWDDRCAAARLAWLS
jgi:hypothetical protein